MTNRPCRASGAELNFEENFRVTSDKTNAIQQISDASFEEEVVKARRPVLIDFWAEWCGPCKAIAPMLGELAEEYRDKVTIVKLNVDENPKTSQRFNVRSIPTLILFKNGQVEGQKVGAPRKSDLVAFLDSKL
jgi:thioredoxin 1